MNVTWSDEAIAAMRDRLGPGSAQIRLVYDTEGCGCAVNGVPVLWAADRPEPGEVQAESAVFPLWHKKEHEIYFDPELRIGYRERERAFTLSSDSQIYTNRLAFTDRRNAAPER